MEKILGKLAALICCTSISSASFAQCSAPTMSWRWWSNLADAVDYTLGPGIGLNTYSQAFADAIPTYIATDLDPGLGPNGEGLVEISNGYYGNTVTAGYVRVYSGSLECTYFNGSVSDDADSCTGSTKADNAKIIFNDTWTASLPQNTLRIAYAHEIGHIFGLAHQTLGYSGCNSFMRHPVNGSEPYDLRSWEVNWINSTYP